MNTVVIRNKLHQLIDRLEDKKVKAVYTLLEENIEEMEESQVEYTPEFKAELDRRYEEYKKGPSTAISQEESQRRIQKILNAARNKDK